MKRTDQDTMGFPKRTMQVAVWPGAGVAVMTDEFCTGGGREEKVRISVHRAV